MRHLKTVDEEFTRQARTFADSSTLAAIVNEPMRMSALETLLRLLARGGESAGVQIREEEGVLWFTYTWVLFEAAAV